MLSTSGQGTSVIGSGYYTFSPVFVPNWWVDLKTGKMSSINVDVQGTVRATNLYNNVCLFNGTYYSTEWYYCADLTEMTNTDAEEGWNDHNSYKVGQYYEWTAERKAGHYGNPPTGFVQCTYDANIINMIPPTNNSWSNKPVVLPNPADFVGKVVEITGWSRDTAEVDMYVDCAAGDHMAGGVSYNNGFYPAYVSSRVTIRTGCVNSFMSMLLSGSYYWVKL